MVGKAERKPKAGGHSIVVRMQSEVNARTLLTLFFLQPFYSVWAPGPCDGAANTQGISSHLC